MLNQLCNIVTQAANFFLTFVWKVFGIVFFLGFFPLMSIPISPSLCILKSNTDYDLVWLIYLYARRVCQRYNTTIFMLSGNFSIVERNLSFVHVLQ